MIALERGEGVTWIVILGIAFCHLLMHIYFMGACGGRLGIEFYCEIEVLMSFIIQNMIQQNKWFDIKVTLKSELDTICFWSVTENALVLVSIWYLASCLRLLH